MSEGVKGVMKTSMSVYVCVIGNESTQKISAFGRKRRGRVS